MKPTSCLGIAVATAAVVSLSAQAMASSQGDVFKDQRITLIVGYAAGGGYDTYARLAAPHFARNLPGSPSIVVQNMPGADSLAALNHLYNRAPRDGTAIAMFSRSLPVAPLLGQLDRNQAQFDPTRITWIGSLNNEVSVVAIWAATGIKTIEDAKANEVLVGSTGLTSNNAVYPYVSNNVLGTRFKVIIGYPGTSHMTLAMERGEIHGNAGWSYSSLLAQHRDWVEQGTVNILMQLSTDKHPDLPHVPLIMDFAQDETERRALELVFAPLTMGRPLAGPPEISEERTKALRDGFDATMKDPEFLEVANRARMAITPVSGAGIQRLIDGLYNAPPAVVERAKHIVERGATQVDEAVIPFEQVQATITAVRNEGRRIDFTVDGQNARADISGSNTTITIGGASANRSAITVGMQCEVDYQGSGSTARSVACQ